MRAQILTATRPVRIPIQSAIDERGTLEEVALDKLTITVSLEALQQARLFRDAVEIHARDLELPEDLVGVDRTVISPEDIVARAVIVARSPNDRQGKATDSDQLAAVRNRKVSLGVGGPPDVVTFTTEGSGPDREPFGCSEQCVQTARTGRSGIIPVGHLDAACRLDGCEPRRDSRMVPL